MKLVIDSNILFSVIIKGKDSSNYKIIEEYRIDLYFPEDGLLEYRLHSKKLESKSNDFTQSLFLAFSLIKVIPYEFYKDKLREANQICRQFDEKDTPFVALALKLNIPIWTNDKKLIESSREYEAISSKDLQKRLEEL